MSGLVEFSSAGTNWLAPIALDTSASVSLLTMWRCSLRVYDGPHGYALGVRWGRPVLTGGYNLGWLDYEIPNLSRSNVVDVEGCVVTARWTPEWRGPVELIVTYDANSDSWDYPVVRELHRVYLPIMVR